jgi:hypothetical protein
MTQSKCDSCLFLKRQGEEELAVPTHVDDLTIAGTKKMVNWFKSNIGAHLEVKLGGELKWILGMRVTVDPVKRTLKLDQPSYVEALLERFGMENCKPVATPAPPERLHAGQCPRTSEEHDRMRGIPYSQLVGSLMYLSVCTRPDITAAVQTLARFMSNPGWAHWCAAKRVLRYLKGTVERGLCFGGRGGLKGYCDADWGGDVDSYRSTTGYVFLLNGAAVSWRSRLQRTVALSTAEAEYMALCEAAQEATFLTQLLTDLGEKVPTVEILEDNQAAMVISKNEVFHPRTKHIGIKYHYTRECVSGGTIKLVYCATAEMVADALTKPLPAAAHEKNARVMLGEDLASEGEC